MTTAGFLDGMDDPRLKPRMLRSLTRDLLPDEKRPFPTPSKLSSVLSYVKTHGLLTEIHSQPSDRKLVDAWRSAVDGWVDLLLSLVSSTMPDKCWPGICLLGVTCEECSSDRFTASYALWFQKLLSTIQPSSSAHFVKVASCSSMADLFTRLADFPNLKKDAISLARGLALPILQLLNGNEPEAVWEGAINLLCTLITMFPSSMHRHYDSIEAVLVSRIMSSQRNGNVSKNLANCLAMLPKVRGDQDSWSLLMQKILMAINVLLKDAFHGLEEEAKMSQITRLLVPPGKEPPPPLGGQSEASEQTTTNDRELLATRVSYLMRCCCIMLTNPYPAQMIVPIHFLLALVGRVLLMDGSLQGSLLPLTTAMHQELLCAEIPALHLDSLDLLMAVIKGVRSQLLPHAANVVRLLTKYFRRATLPSIRIKVYSIMQILLISMGAGMALYLAQEVISNASADLNVSLGIGANLSNEATLRTSHRKRKHISASPMEQPNGTDDRLQPHSRIVPTSLSVKIAALKALEALLMVGGSLRSESWRRSDVDYLVINVATNACDEGWGIEGKCLSLMDSPVSLADFQLAALEALLASLLSPCHVRPPYLSQGLELFHRGKQETGTKVAAFCVHAVLALEVLIHPRSLPLIDAPDGKSYSIDEGLKHGHQKLNISSLTKDDPAFISDHEYDDDFMEFALDGPAINKHVENAGQLLKGSIEETAGERDVMKPVRDLDIVEGRQQLYSSDVEMACSGREENVMPNKDPKLSAVVEEKEADVAVSNGADLSKDLGTSTDIFLDRLSRNEMEPGKDIAVSSNYSLTKDVANGFESLGTSKKESMLSYDSDSSSIDSLPSIVDVDPDSDPESD